GGVGGGRRQGEDTVHGAAGREGIRAAVQGAPFTTIAAVTVLTSLTEATLEQIGMLGPMSEAVRRLAVLAVEAGARGLVCSPQEVAAGRAQGGPGLTPGTPRIPPVCSSTPRPAAT